MLILRMIVAATVITAGVNSLLVSGGDANARGCQALGHETAGVVQSEPRPGQSVKTIATTGPGAASNLIHEEMAFLCG
jgi:hypothetical protein